jgi:DNA-directed RNA polymerase subunit omega
MIHPSYVELMKVVNEETALVGEEPVVNSRYSIVCATAKRARQIIDGDEPYISGAANMKPLSVAVEELYEGKLKILTDEEVDEKNDELKSYLEKKRQQDAIYAEREKEEEKKRREAEAIARAEAEAKAAAKAAEADFDEDEDFDEDFDEEEIEETAEEE